MKQAEQLTAIKEYTIQKLGQDKTGHGMDHINRVVKMSKRLAMGEKVDPFLPIVAATCTNFSFFCGSPNLLNSFFMRSSVVSLMRGSA